MIKKDDSETVINIVKPELSNMITKDDSQSILKIVKPELSNMIKKDLLNLTAAKRYIDIGNRRLVKTADATDKYDVVNKRQLDHAWQSQSKDLADYGERLINLETEFRQKVHGQKAVNVLDFSFDDELFLRIPMRVEVIKFYSTANLKDLHISNNIGTIDLSKPFIIRESDFLVFRIKKE
ncbi:hypothetical protein BDFB_013834, partial [Asbolus verrucosus]